jgi:hypothetical protein
VEDVKRFDHKAMPALVLRDAKNLGHLKNGGYKGIGRQGTAISVGSHKKEAIHTHKPGPTKRTSTV